MKVTLPAIERVSEIENAIVSLSASVIVIVNVSASASASVNGCESEDGCGR